MVRLDVSFWLFLSIDVDVNYGNASKLHEKAQGGQHYVV